jgi:hypothetical protein
VPFIAELERPAVFRRSKLFELERFVALRSELRAGLRSELLVVLRDVVPVVSRVALRLLSLRDSTFLAPLNSPGREVAVTLGRPWFTDAN